ncbi:hypothetical protein B7494_g2684 [Chlorociboria aeruginascens]|nr:hypothetical protein B7494_g2684 [Chlorociboria aeruginascens]
MSFEVVRIPHDEEGMRQYVDRYKAFRLLSLQVSPESFLSTYARESAFTDDVWRDRLLNATTFVALQSHQIVSTLTILGPLPYPPHESAPSQNPWTLLDVTDPQDPAVSHWRINAIFTLPEARGQAIATTLIRKSINFASNEAAKSGKPMVASIAVEGNNAPAKSLYEKCGFVVIREDTMALGNEQRSILLLTYQTEHP